MKNNNIKYGLVLLAGLIASACSGSSTGSTDTEDATVANSGSVVAATFTSSDRIISREILQAAVKQGQDPTTCDALSGDPASVDSAAIDPEFVSGAVTSKTYGPEAEAVTLTETDFCQDSQGNENSGSDLYAYFILTDDAVATCDDGTTGTMLAGSEGVWIQDGLSVCPEIYGSFLMLDGNGDEYQVDCHMMLSCETENEVIDAICVDDQGNTIEMDNSVSCNIDA